MTWLACSSCSDCRSMGVHARCGPFFIDTGSVLRVLSFIPLYVHTVCVAYKRATCEIVAACVGVK